MSKDVKLREGLVTERNPDGVKVTVFENLDCEDCEGTCGGSGNSFEVTARDPVGVDKGDRVEVEIEPRSFGKVALIVFGIPAFALIGGLGVGTLLSDLLFAGSYATAFQGGTAGFLFVLSLAGLVVYDRSLAARSSQRAEISELLERNCQSSVNPTTGSV